MGLSQRLGRLANLALAGQKHQHVAGPPRCALVHRVDQCIVEIGPFFFGSSLAASATGR